MVIIKSRDNDNVKRVRKLQKSAKFRRSSGEFIAEGLRISLDAVSSGAELSTLFVTEDALKKHSEEFALLSGCAEKIICVSENIFSYMSDTEAPQGFLSVIRTLDKTKEFDKIKGDSKFLALENIQDPGNLGAALRSAEAFGVSGVILSSDCCDVYNPKAVRSSMGAVFRLPFAVYPAVSDFLLKNPSVNSYAAVVFDGAEKLTEIKFETPCVTVIGNEGSGLRPETVKNCSRKITIPMKGKAESLNASVASAILMWEMMK